MEHLQGARREKRRQNGGENGRGIVQIRRKKGEKWRLNEMAKGGKIVQLQGENGEWGEKKRRERGLENGTFTAEKGQEEKTVILREEVKSSRPYTL